MCIRATTGVLDPKRANVQLHATALRLTQIQSDGAKEMTQSEGTKELTQQQEKDRKNQRTSHL